ncbi:inosine/guanosine kinase [Peredibacter sp. HCB2-198]|uniref:inosine/guanosine kinase n=1 Tax=Peredibacter sp. HCB2-198 TaxID=3383025 RepID=UPI0038B535F3
MKFPGRRNTKHYFPVEDKPRSSFDEEINRPGNVYVVGIDQLLVDIEIPVDDAFLEKHKFTKGESFIIDDNLADTIYWQYKNAGQITGEFPGGAVGNTLHNFSILSDCPSVALGTINKNIELGDYAFKYICNTSSKVNLTYLQPCPRPMGRALCFVSPDRDRTFAISKGCMNDLSPEFIPVDVIEKAASLLVSAYTLRDENSSIFKSTLRALEVAKNANVPVVLSLGTSGLVNEKKDLLLDIIPKYVSVIAMNESEALSLTGVSDPLRAAEKVLDMCDMVLLTVGARGLYIGALTDAAHARETKEPLHTKSIVEYNKYEYSRARRRADCDGVLKVYSHINPFRGGPQMIKNTNGAGDAALAAVLHDISACQYHKNKVPNSPKHSAAYLTYSSISQISKYSNRVSFEVLSQNSPRLLRGLPEKEDGLEEAYWEK